MAARPNGADTASDKMDPMRVEAAGPQPRPSTRRRRIRGASLVAAAVAALVVVSGCSNSSSTDRSKLATTVPMTPVAASATAEQPAGRVISAPDAGTAMAIDSDRRVLAVLATNRTDVEVYRLDDAGVPQLPPTTITLPVPAAALGGFSDGVLLAVGPRSLMSIDAVAGKVATRQIDAGDPLSVARRGDDVLVGTSDGRVQVVGARTVDVIDGFVRVDAIAVASDGQTMVLDRAQSSATELDVDKRSLGPAQRVGNGGTEMSVDHVNRFLISNTRDDQFIVIAGHPPIMQMRYPVSGGPYAVDYDDTRDLAWVVSTGNSTAQAFDLKTGIPEERHRFATVGQADSMAVDQRTGTVYLLSARGEGLQVVSPTAWR
ncbi:YncE family protein [Gordonia jinhuaensis]|uniref:hypothetical protein n=1 Tax=Gordonia jinhuaensis TaxID=1517702 RepID=UPI001666CBA7|nr:hypothetical protein [Gordonia jinhuaensis]